MIYYSKNILVNTKTIETTEMWLFKTITVSGMMGDLGTIKKGTNKHIKKDT